MHIYVYVSAVKSFVSRIHHIVDACGPSNSSVEILTAHNIFVILKVFLEFTITTDACVPPRFIC